ncbi:MAG: DUF1553 domain-containing protein [Gemmataceae bacterium]|nr:DUF1553 domain-containing protein [Gemmataceae bacterium]
MNNRTTLFAVGVILFAARSLPAQAPDRVAELSVEPAAITLMHGDDRHHVLVSGKLADGSYRDLSRTVRYTSSNPAVAEVSLQGIVTPKSAGQAMIQVSAGDANASVTVTVKSAERRQVSFANDVMPILAKSGCNSGACHGAASGKKGFKISLRGYDPASDFKTLTRGTEGRRLNFNEADRSLFVLKPTGVVPHEGGKRFEYQSSYANVLKRWIAEGAGSDTTTAPRLTGIEVFPKLRSFPEPKLEQQLLVLARYSDGSVRDVTEDARYLSNNERAAEVDESGLVKMHDKGEAALMIRYGEMVAVSNLVIMKRDPAFAWSNPAENNTIDKLVNAKLKHMEILPSELTSDEEFVRRVYYDVIGIPPSPEECRAFTADKAVDKRAKLIDALLDRPEHADYWALKWGDLLKNRFDLLRDKGTWGMHRWVRDSIAANKRFDVFARELITADGSCAENPPANYWRVFTNPEDAAEATIQVFFGVRIMCAKCHDHPFEKWVQKDYYGVSAFFTQVGRKTGSRRDDMIIYRNEVAAQARHPTTGETLNPKFLDAGVVPIGAQDDGREKLAEWMTRKDNPVFAKATVNRLWSHLFGKGIIDPVDDIRSSNPPVNAPLLDALTKDFVDRDFDVRHILRTMLNSRTYQLAARINRFNQEDRQNFSHALPRRLTAEQLFDTVSQATGIRETFRGRIGNNGTVSMPNGGLRAGQLPDRQLTAEMLDLFGRPRGDSSCACERFDETSMTHALHLINGKSLSDRIASPGGKLARLLATPKITNEQVVEELYLLVLCRLPKAAEMELMLKYFESAGDRAKAAQDVMWVLFNKREFLFNY